MIPVVLLMASAFLLRLNHWSPFHHAARTRIKFERDVPDLPTYSSTSSALGGYDPYFTRVNTLASDFNVWKGSKPAQ
jgi:hypothetical protein